MASLMMSSKVTMKLALPTYFKVVAVLCCPLMLAYYGMTQITMAMAVSITPSP
ncbi:secreted protein [Bathymodiolus azoricus thioautotrophic gill symbiont]|uniref:Secreted protein n=1 Tax=Bathymodiolus azoricus thioautotrophic gill symbiont TaxID=235205 RepID=A0A1H6LFY6_9GAMM|nr:secreted protein [Bathymodiolus azoricus thioautotrophic gill symbiont]